MIFFWNEMIEWVKENFPTAFVKNYHNGQRFNSRKIGRIGLVGYAKHQQ